MTAKKRFDSILQILDSSSVQLPTERLLWVCGNLIQEYIADLIFTKVMDASNYIDAGRKSLPIAKEWFGDNSYTDWPFHSDWLIKYIESRFRGAREGKQQSDRRDGDRIAFEKKNPKNKSKCTWYLGCNNTKNLELDHIWPWSIHGISGEDNYQWLCAKHNRDWKKNLIFWDNLIPFKEFDQELKRDD